MIKKHAASAFVCCAFAALVFLFLAAGCFSSPEKGNEEKTKSYAEIMNERLIIFTDCAEKFSDSLEDIAGSQSAPSDSQIARINEALDGLKKACAGLAGQEAPPEYAEAQSALDKAMDDYAAAMEKCDVLLEFFRNYDTEFRRYKNPVEGRAEIEKQERALYDEFAQAMAQASASFRSACEKFNSVN